MRIKLPQVHQPAFGVHESEKAAIFGGSMNHYQTRVTLRLIYLIYACLVVGTHVCLTALFLQWRPYCHIVIIMMTSEQQLYGEYNMENMGVFSSPKWPVNGKMVNLFLSCIKH